MSDTVARYVGLDVHAKSVALAVAESGSNQSPKPVLTARPSCRWRPNWRFQAAMALAASSCGSGISSPSNAA